MTATPSANGTPHTAREAARHYLRHGIYTVPVKPHDKRPWDFGRNRPRDEWEQLRITDCEIDALFADGCNIGVLLGAPSRGLIDIDLDWPEARRAAPHLLPATEMVGGRESAMDSHHFFVVADPPEKASDKFIDPCNPDRKRNTIIELRSTGGQTVVAPSVHGIDRDKGHLTPERFVWRKHGAPARVSIAVLATAVRGIAAAALLGRYWPKGTRHDAALALAGGLRRAGWLEEPAVKFVTAVCAAAEDREVANRVGCVRDTFLKDREEKTTGWPTLAKALGEHGAALVARVADWLGAGPDGISAHSAISARGWPDPIPLGAAPAVPEYPLETLPPVLRDWARAVATELQVPVDLPAALGLGLVAAGIARKVTVQPRPGFTEPTNLYVMAMLPPGERKTQTFRRAIAPVQELQREAREAAGPVVAEAESEFRIAEKRVKHLEDKIAKAESEEKETLRAELKTAREDLAKCVVPVLPLYYSEDDTPESLKLELVRQGGRMMVATTEAKCLENITLYADRPNFDVYLKGHAGDEINSGRIERGRDAVSDPALSCLLAPQPAVAQGLAENEILRGRGFLARWLYQLPLSRVGSRQIGAPPVPENVQAEYENLVRAAWETDYGTGDAGPGATAITFAPDAAVAFEALESWVEPQLAPGGALARMAGWGNKLNGACARLAAALHVAERLGRGEPWADPVPLDVVERAIRLCREYYVPHAVAAFDLMGADVTVAGARRVWEWVGAGNLKEFSKRDAFNANRSGFDTVDDLQPCLDLLERHYLIRQRPAADDAPRGRGRPSSPVYEVNPKGGPPTGEPNPPESGAPRPRERESTPAHKSQKAHKSDPSDQEDAPGAEETPAHKSHKSQKSDPDDAEDIFALSAICAQGYSAATDEAERFPVVRTAEGIVPVVRATIAPERIGLDLETTGLDPARDRVRLLSLATATETFVIDLFALADPVPALAPLFAALAGKELVGHNVVSFDLPFLARLGFAPEKVFDTALTSRVVYAGENTDHDLAAVVQRELGEALDKDEQRSDWSRPELTAEQIEYARRDVAVLLPLADALQERAAERKVGTVVDLEMRCGVPVARMAASGVGFDAPAWLTLADTAAERRSALAAEMDALVPNPNGLPGLAAWNWDSAAGDVPKAFAAVGMTLEDTKEETLAGVDHPLARLLLDYREAAKRANTYGREWAKEHVTGGRVYATWNPCQAKTGRMSCKGPNLQQIPRDPAYRRCFVAKPGHVLVKCDYSQIELRIAAKVTGDQRMLAAYQKGEDLHTLTAVRFLGVGVGEVTKAARQMAKPVNFGAIYGLGPRSLRLKARADYGKEMTDAEAKKFLTAFFAQYPGVRAWHNRTKCAKATEVWTLGGRRIAVDADQFHGAKANYVIQGTGGDGLKRALVLLWERRAECPDAEVVLAVHDEIVVEVPEAKAEYAKVWVAKAMTDAMAPLIDPVPVEVEAKVGRTWAG